MYSKHLGLVYETSAIAATALPAINTLMRSIIILASILFSSTALAQSMNYKPILCGETNTVKEATIVGYNEVLVKKEKNWLSDTDIEWYESEAEGTWTLLESKDGTSCLLAIGKLPGSKT